MTRSSFHKLLALLKPHIEAQVNFLNPDKEIDAETRLAIALYWYASGNSHRHIGDLFGVAKNTVGKITNVVSQAIVNHLLRDLVRFPRTKEEFQELTRLCEENTEFSLPNCFACIDGTHIRIIAQKDCTIQWMIYKGFYCVQLMAVTDYKDRIIAFDVGLPGSCHDAYVLKTSAFYEKVITGELMGDMWTENSIKLYDTVIPPFILGDAAYPLMPWLQKSFGKGHHEKYDFYLSSSRMNIEKTFGQLKNRFRVLLDCRIRCKIKDIAYHIPAILALHNFCIDEKDEYVPRWEKTYDHSNPDHRGKNCLGRSGTQVNVYDLCEENPSCFAQVDIRQLRLIYVGIKYLIFSHLFEGRNRLPSE